jgi:hypothetical protein
MNARFPLVLALAALVSVASLRADAALDAIITKARASIGSEDALNRITSLHFEGTIEGTERVPDPAKPGQTVDRPVRLAIDIVFQKPMQQRQTLRSDKVERTTALDDYDGWEKITDRTGANQPRLVLMDANGIKRLRATTWDNLGFFRGYEKHGGSAQLLGDATVDGKLCDKVAFTYSGGITFTRYFDKSNGRLVKSELGNGLEIREEGEIVVDGVRFPRRLVQRAPGAADTIVTFEKVTVNAGLPASEFAMPSMMIR